MTKGTLSNGFEYEVTDDVLDNWELLEILTEIDGGKTILITKAFPMILGADQFEKLKNHIRKDGKVSIVTMVNTFKDLMDCLNGGKK